MRALLMGSMLLTFACTTASNAEMSGGPVGDGSDYRGPALQVHHGELGGLEVQMMAPTAGHALALLEVACHGSRADIRLGHDSPKAALVAQVLTPLMVPVPAGQLGGATSICIWVSRDGGEPQLALTIARP